MTNVAGDANELMFTQVFESDPVVLTENFPLKLSNLQLMNAPGLLAMVLVTDWNAVPSMAFDTLLFIHLDDESAQSISVETPVRRRVSAMTIPY